MDGAELIGLKLQRLAHGQPPRVLDLFAGCGGLSLGLRRAGLAIVAGVEKDPHAAASQARNLQGGAAAHATPRDLTDPTLTPEVLCAALGLGPPTTAVDVVAAGPPCQAFARVGRAKLRAIARHPRAFLHDPRADLHQVWLAWIAAFRPLVVLVENVPDMLNLHERNLAEEIAQELKEMGWRCRYTLLNAVNYGVPQFRERMFLLGLREELDIEPSFPPPTHSIADPPRGYAGSRRVALRLVRAGDLFQAYVEPPVATGPLAPAVGARAAIGDLPPLCPMHDPTARRGARRRPPRHRSRQSGRKPGLLPRGGAPVGAYRGHPLKIWCRWYSR